MKTNTLYIWLISCLISFTSCTKWTDVQPKTEIREGVAFSNEAGFLKALNGVYAGMAEADFYGKEMTWGLVDVMGEIYDVNKINSYEAEALTGKFNNVATELVIEKIWNRGYNCIANDNNLLNNLDNADPDIFTGNNRNLFKGEALGLRAMLHFDLLRLFGPVSSSSGWNQPVLPYVTVYGTNVTPRINGQEFVAKVLDDLRQAEELLEDDPVLGTLSEEELRARKVRFNYYAVKALQSRVYMWTGDKQKALEAARVVIDAVPDKFPWTAAGSIQSLIPPSYDYIMSSGNIFSLYVNNLKNYTEGKLINIPLTSEFFPTFQPHYGISEQLRQEWYESSGPGVTDYRSIYMLGTETRLSNTTVLYKKLHQEGEATIFGQKLPFAYAERRIPIMKAIEQYYIAAECLAESDPVQAVSYLNTARTSRGINSPLPSSLNADQIRAEVLKEYRKEFPCEGQIFYYYKRNLEKNFVFPLPQREQEYGF